MFIFLMSSKVEYIFYMFIGHSSILIHKIHIQLFCSFYCFFHYLLSTILILEVLNVSPLLQIPYSTFHKILRIREFSENFISYALEYHSMVKQFITQQVLVLLR